MHNDPSFPFDEAAEKLHPQPSFIPRRLLVFGLYLSFIACLGALWLTGTNASLQFLPDWAMHSIESYRLAVLITPLAMLLTCYISLRYISREIMVSPVRYLDERQQKVRDQAHRSAYGAIKLIFLLVPVFFCLQSVLGSIQPATPDNQLSGPAGRAIISHGEFIQQVLPEYAAVSPGFSKVIHVLSYTGELPTAVTVIMAPSPSLQMPTIAYPPASVGNKSFYYGVGIAGNAPGAYVNHPNISPSPSEPINQLLLYVTLFLCLFLMVSALPMSIVTWKERS